MARSVLHFYATAPYACSYLPGRVARSQVATPTSAIDTEVYGELVRLGFRRSGAFTYRPYCDACDECVAVRVPVQAFRPSRAQRRCLRRHGHLAVVSREPGFEPEHYELYLRYQRTRHPGGGMDNDSRDQYQQFLLHSNITTKMVEFREDGALRMVSLVDCLPDGMSSVYTFFDPTVTGSSLGTYGVLWQIQHCRDAGLRYVYLGYWIAGSQKMAYKASFRPIEAFRQGEWRELGPQ